MTVAVATGLPASSRTTPRQDASEKPLAIVAAANVPTKPRARKVSPRRKSIAGHYIRARRHGCAVSFYVVDLPDFLCDLCG